MTQPHTSAEHGTDAARERRVDEALSGLDLAAKVRLLSGASTWSVAPNPDIGLGRLVMSDGPVGVRGENWSPNDPSVQLPSPTAIAATWDLELVERAGHLLAQEARRKGAHVLLAPTVNMHRTPLGGRHFECFSEDQLLTGAIGAAYVRGVQAGGVATTVKHFVANDAETERFTVDNRVDEATLRETYLAPFEHIVAQANPWGVMSGYNSVNGTTMTEHAELNTILREEFGFDGFIVSDWFAARSTVPAALAGMDSAMPGPQTVYGEHLVAAVRDGRVPEEAVDRMARRMLQLAARVGALEGAEPAVRRAELPEPVDGRSLARELAARSFVLLRNDNATLPLDTTPASGISSVALLGLASSEVRTSGGGSATVFAERTVSPLAGLRASLPEHVRLDHAVGADPRSSLPPLRARLTADFTAPGGQHLASVPLADGTGRWVGELPEGVTAGEMDRVTASGTFTPECSGRHTFGIAGVGPFTLTVGGAVLFDGTIEPGPDVSDPATALLHPPEEVRTVELSAGEPVRVELVHHTTGTPGQGFSFIGFSLNHTEPVADDDALLAEAEQAAAQADVAVVVVATTEDIESEGFDRTTLALPGRQDELVERVAAVANRTVVVVNAGAPVLLPWRNRVDAVLLSWFGGQEVGGALADVLLGTAEPGGRLPTTWPAAEEDVPVWSTTPADGHLDYVEGTRVGYRAWERSATPPAYWFGHGLGYTDWSYDAITVSRHSGETHLATATVRLTNTGHRPGRETVQVYLEAVAADGHSPQRWLAGFATVTAAPGETVETTVTLPRRCAQTWDSRSRTWVPYPHARTVVAGRSYDNPQVSTPL